MGASAVLLLYLILPLWLLAGFADYLCHRAARIELNAGVKESLMHLAQYGTVGIGVLAGLFFEINATVIAVMLVSLVAHQAIAIWDVAYADSKRRIGTTEQHIHAMLEMLPVAALLLVLTLAWDQFLALFGLGTAVPRFDLVPKVEPIPLLYLAIFLPLTVLGEGIPYLEELWRCYRHRVARNGASLHIVREVR